MTEYVVELQFSAVLPCAMLTLRGHVRLAFRDKIAGRSPIETAWILEH
jgi:hypothetical protein